MPDPTYEDVYEPPLLDATFIDKIDDLIAELQNLSAPSATNVAVSPTGLHYITEDDAQGALAELDAEAYAINSSLAQKQSKIKSTTVSKASSSANYVSTGLNATLVDVLSAYETSGGAGVVVSLGRSGNTVWAYFYQATGQPYTSAVEIEVFYVEK